MIEIVVVVGVLYIGYREYKSGKLASLVTSLETRLKALETAAVAEVKKVV
jgi:hypothetical protein